MEKTNCACYFAYDEYVQLIDTVGNRKLSGDEYAEEDLGIIERAMNALFDYVKAVDSTEVTIALARFRFEGDEYRAVIVNCDKHRKNIHEGAIANTSALQKICAFYHVAPIFTGDISDRYQVADFCIDVSKKLFDYRSK